MISNIQVRQRMCFNFKANRIMRHLSVFGQSHGIVVCSLEISKYFIGSGMIEKFTPELQIQ